MEQIDIIKNCEFNQIEFLVINKEETLRMIYELAKEEDMRSYTFLVMMINYCKLNKQEIVAELSHLAAFISCIFFNYIEGMLMLSYAHQREAIEYDSKNLEYKKFFLQMYYSHPDIDIDIDYCVKIAKEVLALDSNNEIANKILSENK